MVKRVPLVIALATSLVAVSAAGADGKRGRSDARALDPGTRFYRPAPNPGAVRQVVDLLRSRRFGDAAAITWLALVPRAEWFTSGTPAQVRREVRETMRAAKRQRAVPVLVAYFIPGRDCSQYSAGGAPDSAAYAAWIEGFADGIGKDKAVVILEPDGLGIIQGLEWCPGDAATVAQRYAEMNAAVDRLEQQPRASVYLDATHSGWQPVGEMTKRLISGGIGDAQGFFLNVSNYETNAALVRYGTMISKCLYYVRSQGGNADSCANQYWPAADADGWYAANVNAPQSALDHFVIDSSRNGQGPWDPSAYRAAPYNQTGDLQTWCNPPGRGAGVRPTANTRTPLLDAYLWVKVPGESDGQCSRNWNYAAYTEAGWPTDPAVRSLFDPVREVFDPAAGAWFPAMALELARNASPPLR